MSSANELLLVGQWRLSSMALGNKSGDTILLWVQAGKTTDRCPYHNENRGSKNRLIIIIIIGHGKKIANRSFKNSSQFKCLSKTISNQNMVQEQIKRGLHSGNACYRSVHNLLPYHLLSKNVKIRIYKTIILTWFRVGTKLGLWW
jgi:hypothetical protein